MRPDEHLSHRPWKGAPPRRRTPSIDECDLTNIFRIVRGKELLQGGGRRLSSFHEREPPGTVCGLDERLRSHCPDSGLRPRNAATDRKPMRLNANAELPGSGISGHDGERGGGSSGRELFGKLDLVFFHDAANGLGITAVNETHDGRGVLGRSEHPEAAFD